MSIAETCRPDVRGNRRLLPRSPLVSAQGSQGATFAVRVQRAAIHERRDVNRKGASINSEASAILLLSEFSDF